MWAWIQWGDLRIPTFVLIQSLNASLLLFWAVIRARHLLLSPKSALDLVILVLAGGLIGGRLLHVLWEAPLYYFENPVQVFDLLAGGYVYYGGLALGLVVGWIFGRTLPDPRGEWFDIAAPLVSLGTAFGRLGCFFAGCCYGKICSLPWAFPVTDEKGMILLRHPAPLYSLFFETGVLLILLGLEKIPKPARPRPFRRAGSLFLLWMVLHGIERFLIEFWRDDFRGLMLWLSISQWISLGLVLIGAFLLWKQTAKSAKLPDL